MVQAVVALGGNVGDVARTFGRALDQVKQHEHVHNVQAAGLYRSEAMGSGAGAEFVNSAWVLDTSLNPHSLLELLQQVEKELGRTREFRWGPRTLDLDLIFYGDQIFQSPRLTVPHPHCWYRRFVLTPIESLLPDLSHPTLGLTIRELSQRLSSGRFELALGGPHEVTWSLRNVAGEFPEVDVRQVNVPNAFDVSEASLAVWFGECGNVELEPLWLHVPLNDAEQQLRDTLVAACTEVVAF